MGNEAIAFAYAFMIVFMLKMFGYLLLSLHLPQELLAEFRLDNQRLDEKVRELEQQMSELRQDSSGSRSGSQGNGTPSTPRSFTGSPLARSFAGTSAFTPSPAALRTAPSSASASLSPVQAAAGQPADESKGDLSELQQQLLECRTEIDRLTQEIHIRDIDIAAQFAEAQNRNRQFLELRAQIATLEKELETAEFDVHDREDEIEKLLIEAEDRNLKFDRLHEEVAKLMDATQERDAFVRELQEKLEEKENAIDVLAAELNERIQENQDLIAEADEMERIIGEMPGVEDFYEESEVVAATEHEAAPATPATPAKAAAVTPRRRKSVRFLGDETAQTPANVRIS